MSGATLWGLYEGRERLPCPEDPSALLGAPIGQYHCPFCGVMCLAGLPHLPPDVSEGPGPDGITDSGLYTPYEVAYGRKWPAGYVISRSHSMRSIDLWSSFETVCDNDGTFIVAQLRFGGCLLSSVPMRTRAAAMRALIRKLADDPEFVALLTR